MTVDDRAYCWGYNFFGALGEGTHTDHLTPVGVAGGLRFRQVVVGTSHSCGLTLDDFAYCWGSNTTRELGDGTDADVQLTPVRVAGGLRFDQVVAANGYTCGVTTEHRAYCWGSNTFGQLGDGTRTQRSAQKRVSGALLFRQVSATLLHTCGVTLDDQAYCWGLNSYGELGGGSTGGLSRTPVRVEGGRLFRQVVTGFSHTCGVTPRNGAYCWGFNRFGQLGDGTTTSTQAPVRVAGGLRFSQVRAAGQYHTCGVTTRDRAYCWGLNREGQLGNGTTIPHLRPVAVAGALAFRHVRARFNHTCGVTLSNEAYCWGLNSEGQLGDGTTTARLTPVAVAASVP